MSHIVCTETNQDEWIECNICGYRAKEIAAHVNNIHGVNPKDYGITKCKNSINRVKGENNPGYRHGGKLSPWSKKSKFYSEESHNKAIERSQEGINKNSPVRKAFYKNADDFIKAQTRNLDWFITKYGEEEGKNRHQAKTTKWLNTLKNKSDEEKQRINRLKVGRAGAISKAEQEIKKALNDRGIVVNTQLQLKKNDAKGWYMYDLSVGTKIVEYNGDYWHCNPSKYDSLYVNQRTMKTAQQTWEDDKAKNDFAIALGYEVLVIWESDYLKDKEKTIQECIKFLTQ